MKTKILIGTLLSLMLIQISVFANNENYAATAFKELTIKMKNVAYLNGKDFDRQMQQTLGKLTPDNPLVPMLNSLENCGSVITFLVYHPGSFVWLSYKAFENPPQVYSQLLQISAYCKGIHDVLWARK